MKGKPLEPWRIPNQLQSSKITGEAEKVQTPLGGLIGYRARDRPSVQGLRPIDVGTVQQSPGQSFDQMLQRPHVPSVKNQVDYESNQSYKTSKWTHWLPIGASWPANVGDVRTIGDPKVPPEEGPVKPGDIPRKTLEVPKPPPPGLPPSPPPRRGTPPVPYSYYGMEMFFQVGKRRRYKRVR